jgi:microcystin-dependent protein
MLALAAAAQSVPSLINYQGRLTDQTGGPMPPGAYILQFRLWSDPIATASTNLLWGQQQNVTVRSNGAFNAILGAATASSIPGAPLAVTNILSAFAGPSCYLGVTAAQGPGGVSTQPTEILPRQQLLTVPYAVLAQQAQQAQQAQVASSLAGDAANGLCPPGAIMAYMGTNAPPGWLLCDGSPVSRTQYAALFSVVGTASGSGDGSTTFNLPDLRGMFLRGANGSQSNTNFWDPDVSWRTNEFAGGNAGNAVGSVQADQFRSHYHSNGTAPLGDAVQPGGFGSPTTFGNTGSTGGNETRPKNVYVNYIIRY